MSDRTYGETRDCKGCRFWSEMLARSDGGPIQAVCLSGKEKGGAWTIGRTTCGDWKSGHLGAIDEPGQDPDAYDGEDNA